MPIFFRVIPNTYRDSVSLMQLSTRLAAGKGIEQVAVVMATPANLALLREVGLLDNMPDANPSDVLALVRGLKQHPVLGSRPIMVAAHGRLTVVAQFAAALTPQISRLYLAGGLVSFHSVVETENYGHAFSNFVPNILNSTDLPEVTAQMGMRKVTLGGLIDGAGRRLDNGVVRKAYEKVRNLDVVDQPSWTAEAIARIATT